MRLSQLKRKMWSHSRGINTRVVGWMCNVRLEDRISAEKLRTRLKLNSMREYLHDRRLQWFGHLEKNVIRVLALVN